MSNLLFLIVALLVLSFITGMKILIHLWGKKYRYKSTWDMIYSDEKMDNYRQKVNQGR